MSTTVDPTLRDLTDCGCGSGISVQVPAAVSNRPGLSAVAYRVGTYASFKQTAIARLSNARHVRLNDLTTRDDDDFTIALLDAWAVVGDVLTFYQERIANEAYLRTATERVSLLQLARQIGYELRPGLAANAWLAFTVEESAGGLGAALAIGPQPRTADQPPAILEIGTRVQSVPGPGEKAQTYETIERIEARPEWNAIRPRLTERHPIVATAQDLLFDGLATGLRPGDGLILVPDGGVDPVFRRVKTVTLQDKAKRTAVTLQMPQQPLTSLSLRAESFTVVGSELAGMLGAATSVTRAGGAIASLNLFGNTVNAADFEMAVMLNRIDKKRVSAHAAALRPPPPVVLALRTRAAVFGHNAPPWETLSYQQRVDDVPAGKTNSTNHAPYITRKPSWAEESLADYHGRGTDPVVYLDAVYPGFTADSFVALANASTSHIYRVASAAESSKADFALTSKVTSLRLTAKVTNPGLNDDDGFENFQIRDTSVFGENEALPLARRPLTAPVGGKVIPLDGLVDGLFKGQWIIVCGELDNERGVHECEPAQIDSVDDLRGEESFTTITLRDPLAHAYVRDTVTISANVAAATHGETVQEVLGSGDARQTFPRFGLRQPPLTYVSSQGPSGVASTLEVRINDLLWHEVPSLFGHTSEERIFITRTGDDGRTEIVFGDGNTGQRPPSGQDNIRAKYRKGIGRAGLVRANQLSQLLSRPLGIKGVTNPLDAGGAADPESRDDARERAALTVLTLNKIVSRRDFEDFARGFAGIGKALATPVWLGQARGMLITIAGVDGDDVPESSALYRNLLDAVTTTGDPHVAVVIRNYLPRFFRLAAAVGIEPDYLPDKVLADVRAQLRASFSFAARDFGSPVTYSEVISVIQAVAGVRAAVIKQLYAGSNATLQTYIGAAQPRWDGTATIPAELLTLAPLPVDLEILP